MAISQQKLREIVFQLLFSQNFTSIEAEIADLMMKQLKVTMKVFKEAEAKCEEVILKLKEIDLLVEKYSASYTFQRITEVEKAVLRLAIYELCYVNSLPPKVTISEAIRLTRKFATAESAGFVNAVLDAIYQHQPHLIQDEEENESLATVSI